MRPPSVYANPTCPAGCPCDLLALLHGPHRVALRLLMILLSHHRLPAATIADLLGCDPATVRRWIHRYNAHGTSGLADQPRAGRPPLGSPGSASGSAAGKGRSRSGTRAAPTRRCWRDRAATPWVRSARRRRCFWRTAERLPKALPS